MKELLICVALVQHRCSPARTAGRSARTVKLSGLMCRVAIDMCIGSAIASFWAWRAKGAAESMLDVIPVATGLIVGEGIWAVPQAILNFAGVVPPVCMAFFRSGEVTADIAAVSATGWPLG